MHKPSRRQAPRAARASIRAAIGIAAACLGLLALAAPALAAPTASIGGVPALNATAGTFTFSSDVPVTRFECSFDGSAFGTCTSPLFLSYTADTHTFSVRGVDASGTGSAATYAWTVDQTAPTVPVLLTPDDDTLTNNPIQTFSGTAEPGSFVKLFDGSTQIASIEAAAGSGDWSYTPSGPLDEGTHLWRARAVDLAGNFSAYTATRTLRIDSVPPPPPVVSQPADAAKVNTRTPQFSGTAEPFATIAVNEGMTRLCSTSASSSGSWSCLSTISLADGPQMVDINARDAAGNDGDPTSRSFTLDATPPPAPQLLQPAADALTTSTAFTASGTAEPGSTVKLRFGNVDIVTLTALGDGSWSHSFSGLADGTYLVSAQEVDDYGNRSVSSNSVTIRIDTTAPTTTFATHPTVQSNQTSPSFGLQASEGSVTFECKLDAAAWQPCGSTVTVGPLGAGPHTFAARATDQVGNLGGESDFNWTIDLIAPPAPTITAPANGATITNARPTISGTAEPGSVVEVFAGSTSLGGVPADATTGVWSLTPNSALPQGALQLKARATDKASNQSGFGAVVNATIDSIAPQTTITGAPTHPVNSSSLSFSFSADDANASFACSLDNAAFVPCTSPRTTSVLSEGAHSFSVRATDQVGNVESQPATVSVTIDRTPPDGASVLVAGSAGADGVPDFTIASDDPAATAGCKIDNGAYAPCSGTYAPGTLAAGVHALTVRYLDAAGNDGYQVIPFNVTPTVPPAPPTTSSSGGTSQQPAAPACTVLGADGHAGGLTVVKVAGAGRNLKLTVSAAAAAVARADVTAGSAKLAASPLAIRKGRSTLAVKLSQAPSTTPLTLSVRYYTATRGYGTLTLQLSVNGGGIGAAGNATLDNGCLTVGAANAHAKLAGWTARRGSAKFAAKASSSKPALALLTVTSPTGKTVGTQLFVAGPGKAKKLSFSLSGSRFTSGRYAYSLRSLSADGGVTTSSGSFRAG